MTSILNTGIIVRISNEEFEKMKKQFGDPDTKAFVEGFLSINNYPDDWKEIALHNEIGRKYIFRFILED